MIATKMPIPWVIGQGLRPLPTAAGDRAPALFSYPTVPVATGTMKDENGTPESASRTSPFVVSPSASSGQACRTMNGPFDKLGANGEKGLFRSSDKMTVEQIHG